jgi:transcription initiation factor TFIIB
MINNIDDLTNLTDADLRDIFDNLDFNDPNDPNDKKKVKHAIIYDICPYCSCTDILKDATNGILVCTNKSCGQVIDVILDENPEWRQYEDDKKTDGRCSMPINQLLPISSIGTSISGNYKNRLKTLQIWNAMPYRERSLNNVFKIIHEKCQKGDIIKCIEDDAKIMYKNISDCKHVKGKGRYKFIIIRGKNRESLIGACVFFACRRNKKTRTPKEIADLFELKYTEITKGCKNFLKLMKIKNAGLTNGTSHPEEFVPRLCLKLQLTQVYTDQAVQIAKNIRKLNVASVHTPFSTAICSILLMADINKLKILNKKKLSIMFGVSEVTITKTYNKIEKYRKALINDELTDRLVKVLADLLSLNTVPDSITERLKRFKDVENITTIQNLNKINEFGKTKKDNILTNSMNFNTDICDKFDLEFEDLDKNNCSNYNYSDSDSDINEYETTLQDHINDYINGNKYSDKHIIEGKNIHDQLKHIECELRMITRNTEICYNMLYK